MLWHSIPIRDQGFCSKHSMQPRRGNARLLSAYAIPYHAGAPEHLRAAASWSHRKPRKGEESGGPTRVTRHPTPDTWHLASSPFDPHLRGTMRSKRLQVCARPDDTSHRSASKEMRAGKAAAGKTARTASGVHRELFHGPCLIGNILPPCPGASLAENHG